MRKIAANYIFLPGFPLLHNGYVVQGEQGELELVDTGGEIREIAALEFYGGMIVAGYLREESDFWPEEGDLLALIGESYQKACGREYCPAILEGADLSRLVWKKKARIRNL